jgi:hypothetical protein
MFILGEFEAICKNTLQFEPGAMGELSDDKSQM